MSSTPEKGAVNLPPSIESYKPPQQGFLSLLPSLWVPYAELIRLTRPIGIVIIHCPFLFGSLFAAAISQHPPPTYSLLKIEAMLLFATFFLRGCVVAFNDLADRDLDGKIARTQHRPLARKAITPTKAYIFVITQAVMWLVILSQLSPTCIYYAVPSLALAGLYPYSKRVTHFTPVFLGFTMAWGVFIGCAATNVDPISLALRKETQAPATALFSLYLSCAIWTINYETIYAHQDILDDEKHGVRSMAIGLKGNPKPILSLLAILQVMCLACTGWLMGAGPAYFGSSCGGVGVALGVMVWRVDLERPEQCWWWFSNGTWLVGGCVVVGLVTQM